MTPTDSPRTAVTYEQIELEVTGGVAKITLSRPDELNPLSIRMATEVADALESAAADEGVRAVLITGAGRGFSSGANLGGEDRATTDEGKPNVLDGLRTAYNPLILAVRALPKPVVAAVNGPAAGVGASLAFACDLLVASESAYFLMAFARIGLTIDGGASTFLAAKVGHARASEMAMLAERISAHDALGWGLVNRVVADEDLGSEAAALAERLAAGPTRSYAATKELLNRTAYPDLAEQLDREALLQQEQAESEDFAIGVMAFLGKQQPEFTGR